MACRASMDRPGHRIVANQLDQAPHLAPAAEMDEIAEVAAAARPKRRLRSGIVAETLDQLRRLGEGGRRECGLLKQSFPRSRFRGSSAPGFRNRAGECLTADSLRKFAPELPSKRGLEAAAPSCQRRLMSQRTRYTQAAGSMLAISILAGAVAGVIVGQPSIGFLAGLAAGLLLAILFWLNERRR